MKIVTVYTDNSKLRGDTSNSLQEAINILQDDDNFRDDYAYDDDDYWDYDELEYGCSAFYPRSLEELRKPSNPVDYIISDYFANDCKEEVLYYLQKQFKIKGLVVNSVHYTPSYSVIATCIHNSDLSDSSVKNLNKKLTSLFATEEIKVLVQDGEIFIKVVHRSAETPVKVAATLWILRSKVVTDFLITSITSVLRSDVRKQLSRAILQGKFTTPDILVDDVEIAQYSAKHNLVKMAAFFYYGGTFTRTDYITGPQQAANTLDFYRISEFILAFRSLYDTYADSFGPLTNFTVAYKNILYDELQNKKESK